MAGSAHVIRGDALNLPLPDASVDLVVTSPPYFALRSYQDGGEHYANQLGSEATPAEFVDALIAATREMVRVLKPSGSIWVNLGDKYNAYNGNRGAGTIQDNGPRPTVGGGAGLDVKGVKPKSLIGIPWRYAIACIEDLGLILRAEVIWSKPNGLPESVTDRVRRSHETWFHFVVRPRYFSAVDEIREPHKPGQSPAALSFNREGRETAPGQSCAPHRIGRDDQGLNPLGKLPGSVWTIKEDLWDHVLSGPMHFCPRCGRDLTAGSSPETTTPTATPLSTSQGSASDARPDSSTRSSSDPSPMDSPSTTSAGTRDASTPTTSSPSPSKRTSDDETKPTVATTAQPDTSTTNETRTSGATESASVACVCESGLPPIENGSVWVVPTEPLRVPDHLGVDHFAAFPTEWPRRIIQGWSPSGVCVACGEGVRPVVDKQRTFDGEPIGPGEGGIFGTDRTVTRNQGVGNWRFATESRVLGYICSCLKPTPLKPAVVLDPFGGTGTTALVAKALGRTGYTVDMSADYCRLAAWRTNDPGQLAKAMRVDKPPREADGQIGFDFEEWSA